MSKILTKHLIGDSDISFLSSDKISAPFTQVSNRALIADPSKSLTPLMGIDRIMTHELAELLSEQGPSGARVFKIPNDDKNLIRLVGNWKLNPSTLAYGNFVETTGDTTSFAEVTFYGTGLNMMVPAGNSASDNRVTVDGGVESADVLPTLSIVLDSRNYAPNIIIPLVSGLVPGIHTVKIRNASASGWLQIHGVEIINSSSQVRVGSGSLIKDQRKVSQGSAELFDYKPSSLGSRGGRVVIYSSGGQLQRAVQAVNPSQQNLTSADHTNEEIIDVFHFREFGTFRSDDFTTLEGSAVKAFTLDDGTTTLVNGGTGNGGNTVRADNTDIYRPGGGGDGSFGTITFVGTGLDIVRKEEDANGSNNTSAFVDSVNVGTLSSTNSPTERIEKIVSGLPYGTHTVRIFRNSTVTTNLGLTRFIVYGPKKPTIPADAVELVDYNVMADYVVSSIVDPNSMSTGVLRKSAMREMLYVGSGMVANVNASYTGGYYTEMGPSGTYVEYTFFGTGFEFRTTESSVGGTGTISVDGSSNLSGFTTASFGASLNFVPATGAFDLTNGATTHGGRISVSGLSLGRHVVRVTRNSGNEFYHSAFEIITPIHSLKNGSQYVRQNATRIGSQGLLDKRQIIAGSASKKFRGAAYGVSSSPTTTATAPVPIPDMAMVVPSNGGWFHISMVTGVAATGSNQNYSFYIVINGFQKSFVSGGGRTDVDLFGGINDTVYLPPGIHTVRIYWATGGGTGRLTVTGRTLSVIEL